MQVMLTREPEFRAAIPSDFSLTHFGKLISLTKGSPAKKDSTSLVTLLSWDEDGNLIVH